MNRDLRYERSAYVMARLPTLKPVASRLQSAPMEVRRLGLPLALAGWDREKRRELVQLVAGWLYAGWGMLPERPMPQTARAVLEVLSEDEQRARVRSAAENEAVEVLHVAKVLASAAFPREAAADGT